jgi:hypothetical protein
MDYKVNDFVESLETHKKGILQASYPDGTFLLYHGEGYEHLKPEQMKHVKREEVPAMVLHRAQV